MKMSLQTKVSVLVTLIIIIISALSTYLFITAYSNSKEKGRIIRGTALSFALSKAAAEGLISEDLDLIKKASSVIQAPDVTLAQVYSDIWDAIDAYPFEKLKDPPDPDAISHFADSTEPMYKKTSAGYDFYSPILLKPSEGSPVTAIGFVRIVLSSADIMREIRQIVFTNVVIAVIITLIAIIAINALVNRLVIKPVMRLHHSVALFKNGLLPDIVPVSSSDEIGELLSEFNNMSHSIKEKTDMLVDSEKRIKSLFDRVEHAIFRLNKNGLIIEKNSRFTEMFGDISDLCDILIGDKSAPDCLRKAISEKGLHIEDKAIGKNGNELTILLSLYPEEDGSGGITGFDGYVIDVTEKKNLEEKLLRAQKLEAIGTLAGGIAHDFNNLLAAIMGYSEIILDMTKEGEPFHKPASIIHSAAEKGAELTNKILTVSRKEKTETRPADINEIVKSAVELIQRSFPKNIEIALSLNDKIPEMMLDPSQVQQMVINLCVNARDAMPHGGKLTIETSVVGVENEASDDISAEKGGFLKLTVSDTGIGMSKELQRKIFDPFFTTKETGKGTGLGLYIVHSIVNNHGGYINLYTEPSKGTRFNVYIPVTKGSAMLERYETKDLRGSGTILIIDDEADVRELCSDMLTPLGYNVLLAGGGSDGINIFRDMKDDIELVILDMIMPQMGGREVFQTLKTIKPDVKVLLCSGYSQNGFAGIEALLNSGAKGFIQKPFTRYDIALAIRKSLSE